MRFNFNIDKLILDFEPLLEASNPFNTCVDRLFFTFKDVSKSIKSLKLFSKLSLSSALIDELVTPIANNIASLRETVSPSLAFSVATSISAFLVVSESKRSLLVNLKALPLSALLLFSLLKPSMLPGSVSNANSSALILLNSASILFTKVFTASAVRTILPFLFVTAFITGKEAKSPVLAASITLKNTGDNATFCSSLPVTVSTAPVLLLNFDV